MFSGDSSGTVIVWNTYESIETKSGKRRTKSEGKHYYENSDVSFCIDLYVLTRVYSIHPARPVRFCVLILCSFDLQLTFKDGL